MAQIAELARKLASPVLYGTGVYQRRWRRAVADGGRALVLAYHRVAPASNADPLFGIERALPVHVFEAHMRFARRHFTPLPASTIAAAPGGHPGFAFAVTFDDGYADNLTYATPILKRYGIPATHFLNTSFVGTDRLFWWEQLGVLLRCTRVTSLDVAGSLPNLSDHSGLPSHLSLQSHAERAEAHRLLSQAMMRVHPTDVDASLRSLAGLLDSPLASEGRNTPLLGWDQVRRLHREGFEIGAHGATHANLGVVEPERAVQEVHESVRSIAAQIDAPVATFAYPYGGPHQRSEAAIRAVATSGCQGAFTTEAGTVGCEADRWALPRRALSRPSSIVCAYKVDGALRHDRARMHGATRALSERIA